MKDSVLTIHLGETETVACLLERDGARVALIGQARALPSHLDPPFDPAGGVQAALAELAAQTGQDLGGAALKGRVLVTTDLGGGLRVAVAGLVERISAASAERAVYQAGGVPVVRIALNDGRAPWQQTAALRRSAADVLVIAGGCDTGQGEEKIEAIEVLAARLAPGLPSPAYLPQAPSPVIFAGALEARHVLEDAFRGRAVVNVGNVRPTPEREETDSAARELRRVFDALTRLHPFYAPLRQQGARVRLRGEAMEAAVRRLAGEREENLLILDVDATRVGVYSIVRGDYRRSVWPRWRSADEPGLAGRWWPEAPPAGKLEDYAANRAAKPFAPAADLDLESAWLREDVARAVAAHQDANRVLYGIQRGGSLGYSARYSFTDAEIYPTVVPLEEIQTVILTGAAVALGGEQILAALADAALPPGVAFVGWDRLQLLSAVGAMALEEIPVRVGANIEFLAATASSDLPADKAQPTILLDNGETFIVGRDELHWLPRPGRGAGWIEWRAPRLGGLINGQEIPPVRRELPPGLPVLVDGRTRPLRPHQVLRPESLRNSSPKGAVRLA